MSSWADESEDPYPALEQAPDEYTGGGGVRPRLHLKPRSAAAAAQDAHPAASSSSKSNPFGAAKPREEVLASKGIDASLVDKRVERKASVARLTADQDRQVEALRKELTSIEEKLREANEMELPEEDFRVAAEEKRNELNVLVKGFHDLNLKERNGKGAEPTKERGSGGGGGGAPHSGAAGSPHQRKFERPSERRRRLEQQRQEQGEGGHRGSHGGGHYGDYNDEASGGGGEDPFSSFGGNRGGRGGGGGYHGDRRHSDHRGGRGGGGGYHNDRESRGGGGGGGGYDDSDDRGHHQHGGGGGRRSNSNYNDKYAGDRYNY